MAEFRRFGVKERKTGKEVEVLLNLDFIHAIDQEGDKTWILLRGYKKLESTIEYKHLANAMDSSGKFVP